MGGASSQPSQLVTVYEEGCKLMVLNTSEFIVHVRRDNRDGWEVDLQPSSGVIWGTICGYGRTNYIEEFKRDVGCLEAYPLGAEESQVPLQPEVWDVKAREGKHKCKIRKIQSWVGEVHQSCAAAFVVTLHAFPCGRDRLSLSCVGIGGAELLALEVDPKQLSVMQLRETLMKKLHVSKQVLKITLSDGNFLSESDDYKTLGQLPSFSFLVDQSGESKRLARG